MLPSMLSLVHLMSAVSREHLLSGTHNQGYVANRHIWQNMPMKKKKITFWNRPIWAAGPPNALQPIQTNCWKIPM